MSKHYCNETCNLTHMPILEEDPVVALIVVKKEDVIHPTVPSPNTVFTPVFLPIKGLYDGESGIHVKSIDKSTESAMLQTKFSINGYVRKMDSIDTICESISNGILQMKYKDSFEDLSFVFYHESVYNAVLEEIENRRPTSDDKYKTLIEAYRVSRKLKPVSKESENIKTSVIHKSSCMYTGAYDENPQSKLFASDYESNAIHLDCFNTALDITGHGYGVISGKSSQSIETKLNKIIAKETIKLCNNLNEMVGTKDDIRESIYFYK